MSKKKQSPNVEANAFVVVKNDLRKLEVPKYSFKYVRNQGRRMFFPPTPDGREGTTGFGELTARCNEVKTVQNGP